MPNLKLARIKLAKSWTVRPVSIPCFYTLFIANITKSKILRTSLPFKRK